MTKRKSSIVCIVALAIAAASMGESRAVASAQNARLSDEEAKIYTLPTILGGDDRWDPEALELPPILESI